MKKKSGASKIIQDMKDKYADEKHPSSILKELEDTHTRHLAQVTANELLQRRNDELMLKCELLTKKLETIETIINRIVKL